VAVAARVPPFVSFPSFSVFIYLFYLFLFFCVFVCLFVCEGRFGLGLGSVWWYCLLPQSLDLDCNPLWNLFLIYFLAYFQKYLND
jgi:hypothetical protein